MTDLVSPEPLAAHTRRDTLQRLFALAAAGSGALPLLACGASGAGNNPIVVPVPPAPVPVPPPSVPPPSTPAAGLARLKTALASTPPTVDASTALTVTQGASESAASSFGSGAQFIPPLPQGSTSNLSTVAQVGGHLRSLWPQAASSIAGVAVVPVAIEHMAATLGSTGRIGLHIVHTGSAFELLVRGANNALTLIADGKYVGCADASLPLARMNTTLSAAPLDKVNTTVKFDFGTRATRHLSLYSMASVGACALIVPAGDSVAAWDRSAEAGFAAITDSYGGAPTTVWGWGGLFYQAALALAIPHVDLDAIGGTGYAPASADPDRQLAGNAFDARLASITESQPDLFVTAGSLNDNNSRAQAPYASADDARAGFAAAVSRYYADLRTRLPDAVLAAVGPWQPPPNLPAPQPELDKAGVIKAALAAAGGPWIFVDNINGGWSNSAGASAAPSATDGPWQTVANAAAYIGEDNVHPNAAGCAYLAGRLSASLRAAILAL